MPGTTHHRSRLIIVATLLALVVACSPTATVDTTVAETDPPPAASSTLLPGTTTSEPAEQVSTTTEAEVPETEGTVALPLGRSSGSLTVGELTREYVLHVPQSYEPEVPAPLLLVFHGLTMDAASQDGDSRLSALGEAEGFITVYPEGRGGWQRWLFELDAVDFGIDASSPDLAFMDELLTALSGELNVDPSRIYALGFSNGGWMASAVACTFADRIAAAAIVAGIMDFGDACQRSAPVPLITLHGTGDTYEPFDGGVENAPDRGTLPTDAGTVNELPVSDNPILEAGVIDKVTWWADANGCGGASVVEEGESYVTWEYDCPAGAEVVLYEIAGGDHAWTITPGVDTNAIVWEFLSRQSRAGS